MNEMQDKELDDLFRKSLPSPEIPFQPEAWKAMEAKLDAEDRRTRYYRWIAASVAGLMLLGSSLWVARSVFSDPQQASDSKATVKQEQVTQAKNTEHTAATSVSPMNTEAKTSAESGTEEKEYATQQQSDRNGLRGAKENRSSSSFIVSDNKTEQAVQQHFDKKAVAITSFESLSPAERERAMRLARGKVVRKKQEELALRESVQVQEPERSFASSITKEEQPAEETVSEINGSESSSVTVLSSESESTNAKMKVASSDVNRTNEESSNDQELPATSEGTTNLIASQKLQETPVITNTVQVNPSTASSSVASTPTDEALALQADSTATPDTSVLATTTDEKELLTRSTFKRGFSLSLVVNPEFSSTTDFSFYKPGFNFGLYAEYYLSPRFSILAGVLYSKKVYACSPYDYASAPSYDYWGQQYTADAVNAYCSVLDIPINVRYKFLNRKSFNLYAAAGLSSYIMVKENYNFEYQMPYGTKNYSYEIDNKNRYLFNVGNISLGIEKYISNHWSVQAEPYIKTPFGGVGAGKIKLVSTGMYFSVKYYFR